MSQYGNKKYANTHKPPDFDSSEPVRYNQSRTGSTQTMTVCKNQATVRLHQVISDEGKSQGGKETP